ncbi:sel1 repeat family protein [Pseudoxanthomonas helianthi]|uniref:Sel1 repeat family protein n=1 Tax=Pseudoxanthomonas helianthi TaxID=1453541 RepID=A0A941AWX1_9GAMM|nr:sel1 repeat family protein [Pseudoxanthomonas helianthi]MBP3984633.1 sel1 repeat family protein [Pseudoxanthomonas helianthi]
MNRKSHLIPFLLLTAGVANIDSYAQSPSSNAGKLLANEECNGATYQFLPGDFNYCVARKMWGRGNYKGAEELLLLAAGWGSKPAQHLLGIAYFNGDGLAKNRPAGLAWLGLAAERGNPTYLGVLKGAYAVASTDERQQGNILYAGLLQHYRDDVAARRAERRFNREVRALAGNPVFNPGICLVGITAFVRDSDGNAQCPPAEQSVKALNQLAEPYFEGWKDRVQVGPMQQVGKP